MKHLPNIITTLRILIIPWIPYVFINLKLKGLTLFLVIAAAISDFLDGYLARKLDAGSLLGQVLDPLADKLFLLTIIYTLFASGDLPRNFVFSFLGIESIFIIAGGFLWLYNKDLLVKAGTKGKVATALFFIISILSFTPIPSNYLLPGYYLVMILKVLAMFEYGGQIFRMAKDS